jgi:RNA polymerase sigma-70 factor (ECF subfamily)
MDEHELQSRLSRITTVWTLLADAQKPSPQEAKDAYSALIERYKGAAYRYLLGATHSADAADELFQEFAVRMLQGAFRRADPGRGRFRDYLKTTLFHLVSDYQRKQRRGPLPLDTAIVQPAAADWDSDEAERRFLESWCEELLGRAWAALKRAEEEGRQPYYTVLKFRAEHPDASSPEMAQHITEQLHPERPYTETAIRKVLQRARACFADALLREVAHSLPTPTREELEQELIHLNLLGYCRSALERWGNA